MTKMMLLAAAAALTLGSATAFASDGGDWYPANAAQYQTAQNLSPSYEQGRSAAPSTQRSSSSGQMFFATMQPQNAPSYNPNFGGGGNG